MTRFWDVWTVISPVQIIVLPTKTHYSMMMSSAECSKYPSSTFGICIPPQYKICRPMILFQPMVSIKFLNLAQKNSLTNCDVAFYAELCITPKYLSPDKPDGLLSSNLHPHGLNIMPPSNSFDLMTRVRSPRLPVVRHSPAIPTLKIL